MTLEIMLLIERGLGSRGLKNIAAHISTPIFWCSCFGHLIYFLPYFSSFWWLFYVIFALHFYVTFLATLIFPPTLTDV